MQSHNEILTTLQSHAATELVEIMRSIALEINRRGYSVRPYSKYSIEKLPSIPVEVLSQLIRGLKAWLNVLSQPVPDAATEKEKSVYYAKLFLNQMDLSCDDEFWKTIDNQDVIEIYNLDGIQIYRSLNFFRYCTFSLLDMAVNEWFVLWHRPTAIVEMMHEGLKKAYVLNQPVLKAEVPKHVLRETNLAQELYGSKPNAAVIEFRHVGLGKRIPTAPTEAFVISSRGEVIAEGTEAQKIQFV